MRQNPIPFMDPEWNLGAKALGVSSWAEITLDLIRRLTAPGAPSHLTAHFAMRGPHPALRFQREFLLDVIRHRTEVYGDQPTPAGTLKTYDRWLRRSRDYGLERVDLYDNEHRRDFGWYALDLHGAYDALWAILGVPHPLETEFPPFGGRGLGEAREFELLESGLDRLRATYPESMPPSSAIDAFKTQLERHSRFYSSQESEDQDLLRPEHPLEPGQYVRHYAIYPSTLERVQAAEAMRVEGRPGSSGGCPYCRGQRRGAGYAHAYGCRLAPVPVSTATGSRHESRSTRGPCQECGGRYYPFGHRHEPGCSMIPAPRSRGRPGACPGCRGRRSGAGFSHAKRCPVLEAVQEQQRLRSRAARRRQVTPPG